MNYSGISKCSICDGLGVRVVLFVSGCDRHCKGCQNPQTWDCNYGKPFTEETMDYLLELVSPSWVRGVTLSGGDPLHVYNREGTLAVAKTLKGKYPEKDIWMYTGFSWDDIKNEEILSYIDVLVDGEFVLGDKNLTLPFRGSSNQRIINVPESLKSGTVILLDM